ncbi:uncharacterized protein BXIN_2350 [Babesia sp. Xinjiang]|uniref:uncharacterized protein n=1 Tax=Babesia sp. Xinjiang TaxID=462227 RepID=UPI000A22DA79|nr:uncharacterized protein BXIN_2350 [Babesia sp. Xinjiang]ORM40677.1 hypothetical protein BXIN_2350 [Babesia sp. Xinjiang]
MKYLLGGSTGLVKLVETADRSIQRFFSLDSQSLDRRVTCMCWSGGSSGNEENEFAAGLDDGSVEIYAYPSMEKVSSFALPSRCVHIHMLGDHFDVLGKSIYASRAEQYPSLYPDVTNAKLRNNRGRYICCISQCGTCVVVDCDKLQYNGTYIKLDPENMMESEENQQPTTSMIVAFYNLKRPVSAVAYHSLMTNRIVVGSVDLPPLLFDIFIGQVLWIGKLPHPSLLGLKSHLDVRSICFLEELGPDIFALSTSDSFIYIYDMTCQRKPVYDINICDHRSRCISARMLALHEIKEYNTDRRKEVRQSVNELYTADLRNIVKLTTPPHRMLDNQSHETKDVCDLFASDNYGSIYHFRVITGDTLVNFLRKKLQKYKVDGSLELTRDKIIQHLIAARKRFGSASANDRPLHCAPPSANQYICQMRGCYTIHNGAVTDIKCIGHYLISVGLDRFTSVYNVRTRKRLFNCYCNQKQTCILPLHSQFYQEYETDEFKQLEVPVVKRGPGPSENSKEPAGEPDDDMDDNGVDEDDLESHSGSDSAIEGIGSPYYSHESEYSSGSDVDIYEEHSSDASDSE